MLGHLWEGKTKTPLEACEGQGSRAILPSPISFDAVVPCKTRKERRQSGLSHGLQGNQSGTVPHGQEPRCVQHQPAARGKHSWCHRRGKRGGSPGPSGEHKPTGLCSMLFTPNKDTESRCPPEMGFPYFLSVAAAPEAQASRCAGASLPAPLQPATADPPWPSLAPEPPAACSGSPWAEIASTALACLHSPTRQTHPCNTASQGTKAAPSDRQLSFSLPLWAGSKGRNTGSGVAFMRLQTTENTQACKTCVLGPASGSSKPDGLPQHHGSLQGRGVGKGRRGCGPELGSGGRWQAEVRRRAAAGTRTTERLMSDLFIFLQLCVIDLSDLGQFGSVI